MPKYEVCVVYKEYRWVEIDADNIGQAEATTWSKIEDGLIERLKAQDSETEVYVEGEVMETENV